ncbi:MAG: nuclear transport factor 2 family protein, partial [Pseudomonadota bacterium]
LTIFTTILAGFQAYYSVDHDGPSHAAMTVHRNWAVPSGAAILLLAFWRWRTRANTPSAIFIVLLAIAAVSLSVTAWWGGKLVYGHGLGVARMPVVTGEGHDHEHAPGQGHGDEAKENDEHAHEDGEAHDHDDETEGQPENDSAQLKNAPAFDASQYPQTPEGVINAYAAALRAGDEGAVRAMLAPDVIIAEGGGAERSVDEYAGDHMPSDMAFTAAVDFSLKKRDVIAEGDVATVISESQVHGTFKEQTIHSRMMETMVLRRMDGQWRIVHIHWSSAPITGEHEH